MYRRVLSCSAGSSMFCHPPLVERLLGFHYVEVWEFLIALNGIHNYTLSLNNLLGWEAKFLQESQRKSRYHQHFGLSMKPLASTSTNEAKTRQPLLCSWVRRLILLAPPFTLRIWDLVCHLILEKYILPQEIVRTTFTPFGNQFIGLKNVYHTIIHTVLVR